MMFNIADVPSHQSVTNVPSVASPIQLAGTPLPESISELVGSTGAVVCLVNNGPIIHTGPRVEGSGSFSYSFSYLDYMIIQIICD